MLSITLFASPDGGSTLSFLDFRNLFSELRSSTGLLLGLGTKNSRLKKSREVWFSTFSTALFSISPCNASISGLLAEGMYIATYDYWRTVSSSRRGGCSLP